MEKMKKWYKSHQKPALIGTITILLLLIGYLAGRIYFNDKFLKGTVINDCSVETLSLKQANQKLEKQVSSKSLTLVFNDGQSEVLQANQLGISYNEKNSLQKVLDQQNKWLWFTGFFSQNKQTLTDLINVNDEEGFEIEIRPFVKAVKQAGFAAASYETSNLLSGIVCDISENVMEIASTDGNRLARVRETIDNKDNHSKQLIIPSKTLNEFIKMSSFIDEDSVKIYTEKSRLIIKSEKTTTISRLLEGQFPKYNQLIPAESPKEALVNVSQMTSALERVSIMVNEKTSSVKLEFSHNNLKLSADTPDSGKSEENIDIDYAGEELTIAFNYKFVLEALKNIDSDEVKIGLNTPLSATMFKPNSEEDYVCLIMPVQIR